VDSPSLARSYVRGWAQQEHGLYYNPQNYNRYTYVLNNPLAYTDPTGMSFWTEVRRPVAAIAMAVIGNYVGTQIALANGSAWVAGNTLVMTETARNVIVVASGFASGLVAGGNVESALQGALGATLYFGVGEMGFGAGTMSNIAAHAAVGCAQARMAGGSCRGGALAAGFAEAILPIVRTDSMAANAAMAGVVGGVGSMLGGGKFANGATTAAFGYLFNNWAHEMQDGVSPSPELPGSLRDKPSGHSYPAFHYAGRNTPEVLAAASEAIHSWNAPTWGYKRLGVGEARDLMLWGGQPIFQTSRGPYEVVNETKVGHRYHGATEAEAGRVIRTVVIHRDHVWIRTVGIGPNASQLLGLENAIAGHILFQGIVGPVNQLHMSYVRMRK
jgi:hypothetical protein